MFTCIAELRNEQQVLGHSASRVSAFPPAENRANSLDAIWRLGNERRGDGKVDHKEFQDFEGSEATDLATRYQKTTGVGETGDDPRISC